MRFDDDMTAFKDRRAVLEAAADWLVNAAFCDLLAGNFDSYNVHEALKLGQHADYPKLKAALAESARAARHAGAR